LNPRAPYDAYSLSRGAPSASWVFLRSEKMAPQVGLEPTTDRLTADSSTTELLRNIIKACLCFLATFIIYHLLKSMSTCFQANLRFFVSYFLVLIEYSTYLESYLEDIMALSPISRR